MRHHALVFAAVMLPAAALAQSPAPAPGGPMDAHPMPPMLLGTAIEAAVAKAKAAPPKPLIIETIAGGANFAVNLEYRPVPGAPPYIHNEFYETITVLDGSGTFTIGGTLINEKKVPSGAQGTGITGGATQHITKGDMLFVPPGTVHGSVPDAGAPLVLLILRTPLTTPKP